MRPTVQQPKPAYLKVYMKKMRSNTGTTGTTALDMSCCKLTKIEIPKTKRLMRRTFS